MRALMAYYRHLRRSHARYIVSQTIMMRLASTEVITFRATGQLAGYIHNCDFCELLVTPLMISVITLCAAYEITEVSLWRLSTC